MLGCIDTRSTTTRPDTRLPQSRAGGQGLYLWSLNHLGRSSEAKDCKIDQEKLWVGWENPFLPDGNLSKEADRMLEIWRKSGIWICDQQSCTHSQVEVFDTVKVQSSESENGPKTPKVPTLTDVKQRQKCCHLL